MKVFKNLFDKLLKTSQPNSKESFLPPPDQIIKEQENSNFDVDEKTFEYVKSEMDKMSKTMLNSSDSLSENKETEKMLMMLLVRQLKQLSVQIGELQLENKVLKEYMTAQALLSEELINMFGEFMNYVEQGNLSFDKELTYDTPDEILDEEVSSEKDVLGYSDIYGNKTKNKKLIN